MGHNTVVVGYRYHIGAHLTLCHGTIDEVEEIRVGGRVAWAGNYSATAGSNYRDVSGASITTSAPQGNYRRDRVVLDTEDLVFRYVLGTATGDHATAGPPPVPAGTISLGTILSWSGVPRTSNEADFPRWYPPDNTARDGTQFENPGVVVLSGNNTTIGSGSVTASSAGPSADRSDRIVLDIGSMTFDVLQGQASNSQGYPVPPATPNGKISLAVVVIRGQGRENPATSTVYHYERQDRYFTDPDNDFQVSVDFINFGDTTYTYNITGGTIKGDQSVGGIGTGDLWLSGPDPYIGRSKATYHISSGAIARDLIGDALFIDKPDLFGGEKREGGVRGRVSLQFGGSSQPRNSYLQRILGAVPAFRGIAGLVLEQTYIGTIARLKPWAITARREPDASGLNASYASIGTDANPAHMLYELITNSAWGMGYSGNRIDTAEFDAVAQTLHTEGFGLSILWSDANTDAEAMAYQIAGHIDASLYVDIATGKWRITLHRDDYTASNLPVLDRDNVVEVAHFRRRGYGEIVSQLTITYIDGEDGPNGEAPSWKQKAITQHNLAALRAQGGRPVSQTQPYPGITNKALANKVLARDLKQLGQPLARLELVLPATESGVRPGSVYRWSDSDYGVTDLPIRIVEADYGTVIDGRIRIKAVEDVFGSTAAVYADPTPTQWSDPVAPPSPAPYRRLMEATYYHVAQNLDGSATLLSEFPDDAGRLVTQAVGSSQDTYGYDVWVDPGGGYAEDGDDGEHCPTATLAGAIGPADTLLTFNFDSAVDLARVEADEWAYIGNEIVAVRSIDATARVATVDRGIFDTVPTEHTVGTRVFFGDGFETYSQESYAASDQVDVKLTPTTSGGTLELANAPTDTITFNSRFIRPYPPGRVRLDGDKYPDAVDGTPVVEIAWAHRDRTQQTGPLIDQDAADIGPEVGTTYTLRIHDEADNLVRTEGGITGTSYTYTVANEDADGGPFTALRIELESVRDGHTSWQYQDIFIDLAGYGRRYGDYYGGI